MAITIGLIFNPTEKWIAGAYYVENLVAALCTLDREKPFLKIYSEREESFSNLRSKTNYPHLEWVRLETKLSVIDRLINKISFKLIKVHLRIPKLDDKVDFLFVESDSFLFDTFKKKLYWIPDFQEYHYPHFFSSHEILRRQKFQQELVRRVEPIVFSSRQAKQDFFELYPKAENKTFVMPFAVTLPVIEGTNVALVKKKFQIESEYFICSNQFWAHKNHRIVLEALRDLKAAGITIRVVFTGKPYDFRNPHYYEDLLAFASSEKLNEQAIFLGFIDRADQLALMKGALAIIQPSLFEGWSTVIEDGKSLKVPILASDIPVHREQLGNHDWLFNPADCNDLTCKLQTFIQKGYSLKHVDYYPEIVVFGRRFLTIAKELD
jgi:glycosyltransferase involved in cell wall biosynthesis